MGMVVLWAGMVVVVGVRASPSSIYLTIPMGPEINDLVNLQWPLKGTRADDH